MILFLSSSKTAKHNAKKINKFRSVKYLQKPINKIEQIVEKYVEMNIAYPFRECWASNSHIEIKQLLCQSLTNQINDRALFMQNIDISYYYEGYNELKTDEL